MQNSKFKILLGSYLSVVIGLFFYSFTQVDLGLTLSQWSVWQVFQKFFQQIGYFNRPLSTFFYLTILTLLFIFYIIFLILAYKKKLSKKQTWFIIASTSIILLFAYNAFSYDLFNYVFDVKIITFYHQNPYEHRALDYPGNPMLGFMHWTQRTYPYGPFWLFLTVPFGFLDGFRLLLLTMMLFKGIAFVAFLGSAFGIWKIMQKISPENELFATIFFALNPLVLIESLVSAHNDIVMMFLSIWSLYLLMDKKYFRSLILLVLSIAIKFATAFLIPVLLIVFFMQAWKKKINWEIIFYALITFMIAPVIAASIRTNFQPWYLLYVLPFAAILAKKYFVLIPVVIISFFALLQYVPFLYLGNWDPPVPMILRWLMIISIIFSLFVTSFWFARGLLVRKR